MTTDGFLAVRNGNLPLLKHLIAEKKTSLTHTRWSGMTLLHRAADVAQVEIIKYLMEIGADASAKTFRGGDTPLHLAVSAGHEKAVLACVEIKFTARSSSSTPSTRCLLDGVAMPVPHHSTEPARPRHRREMYPTHWLISTQPSTFAV